MENQKIQRALQIENKRNKAIQILKDKQMQKEQNEQDDKIDRIIEKLIERKEEIAIFINDFFKTSAWEITKDSIQKCEYPSHEKMMVYKIKEKEVYFFIKLQKSPNYHIAYHILTECTNFIKNWKAKGSYHKQAPIIVPIVIYIGRKNWSNKTNTNIRYTSFQDHYINLSYNFVDLLRYQPIELIRKKSLISSVSVLKMPVHMAIKKQILHILKNETEEIDIYLQIKDLEQHLVTK